MDGLVQEVDVVVVVDMLVTETTGGATGALVSPVVMMVRDVEVAKINVAERSIVTDERGLPVVVEVVPRDRDEIRSANNVNLSVLAVISVSVDKIGHDEECGQSYIVVRPLGDVGGELVVVDPNARRVADGDAIVIEDVTDLKVLDNDIVAVEDVDASASDVRRPADANDGRVRTNLEALGKNNFALDPDDFGLSTSNGGDKILCVRCVNSFPALTTGGHADGIVLRVAFDIP